jgi:hypothetical protein
MGAAQKHVAADTANSNAKRTRATYHSGSIYYARVEYRSDEDRRGPAREDPCKAETIPTLLWAANILLKLSVRKFSYL